MLSHIQYVLQQVQRKVSPTHTWTHFWKKEKIIHSIFGSLPPLSLYAPLPFPLYRCGYLISTIDKFLFLITIVLCCAKVRHLVDKSKNKTEGLFQKENRGMQGQRPTKDIFFCIQCEYRL